MHLFAGIGGGLLADLILGHRPIIAVEWDKYCCQVLRERAADGWFPELSVWEGDVRLFNPSEYAGQVDCIHAGFPCQPFSNAGLRKGSTDSRGDLFAQVLRCVEIIRPKYIFLENVPGLLTSRSPTCLCGWPYRRGGLHSHSQTVKKDNFNLHGNSTDEYVGEGSDIERPDNFDVRRQVLQSGLSEEGMGESMAMAYQRGYSQRVSDEDIAVFDAQKTASRISDTASQVEVEPADTEEWDSMLESASEGIGGEDERVDAQAEPEGARCPECGRGLVQPDSRHIWYMDSIQWSLAAMGYDTQWLCIRASDVGAPHGRDRWFCLAIRNTEHDGQLTAEVSRSAGTGSDNHAPWAQQASEPTRPSEQHAELAYSDSQHGIGGSESQQPASSGRESRHKSGGSGENVGNANSEQCEEHITRNKFSEQIEQRTPRRSSMGSGGSWWQSESLVGRVAHGVPNRVGMLKGLGNAQVPLQAATAFTLLAERMMGE